jgi:hypothetical protein
MTEQEERANAVKAQLEKIDRNMATASSAKLTAGDLAEARSQWPLQNLLAASCAFEQWVTALAKAKKK